jgi:aryl sulfotransferase
MAIKGVTKGIAGGVALVAIVIGLVGKLRPDLFLKHVPHVGFIFWAMTGNRMPPNFDSAPYTRENFHQWIQDGDIIQATMAKSGTIWLAQISHLLKNNGSDDYANLHDEWGFLELLQYPGQSIDERITSEKKKRKQGQPMSWFSHQFPSEQNYGFNATLHPNAKYLVSARNGKDIIRSFTSFINSFTKEYKSHWGGYPPRLTKEAVLKMLVLDTPDFIFGHLQAWWQLRNEPNVLMLHYANLKADSPKEIRRIAKFMGDVELTDNLLATVVHKSSFQYMKENQDRMVTYFGPPHDRYASIEEGRHINTGNTGDAEDFFTAEMDQMWDQGVKRWWSDADPGMVEWIENGGSYN